MNLTFQVFYSPCSGDGDDILTLGQKPGQSQLACKVVRFVEKYYAEPLCLADFARALPYSKRHLARVFKQEMRITLFEYVRLYRILMASLALCETDKAIIQIGLDSGYASLSSFYRDFNMVYGIPPKLFRKTFSVADIPDRSR